MGALTYHTLRMTLFSRLYFSEEERSTRRYQKGGVVSRLWPEPVG